MTSERRTPSARFRVADGQGGLREVDDHRDRGGPWSYQTVVPASQAEDWMAHLEAAQARHGWSHSGLTQIDSSESSGSITVRIASGAESPSIEIAWTKERDRDLLVAARPGGRDPPDAELVADFLEEISSDLAIGARQSEFRRGWLEYSGLPWTGELWLAPDLRLGPPSRFPEALIDRQIVLVDAVIEGIGATGIRSRFEALLRELRLVLSPVIGAHLEDRRQSTSAWVPDIDGSHYTDCRLRPMGYVELATVDRLPTAGMSPTLPLLPVERPALHAWGVWPEHRCIQVPADVVTLWHTFRDLGSARRAQFLRACNAYSIAQSMWPQQRTAYAAFMVIACEALKPGGRLFKNARIYDVVATLLDPALGLQLESLPLHPQKVRSDHVHRGEIVDADLGSLLMGDPFRDPAFDEMLVALARTTRQCLIEWLRRGGLTTLTWLPRPNDRGPRAGGAIWDNA